MNFIVRDFDVSWLAPTNQDEERDWTVGLPVAPVTAWVTLSSVQFCISLNRLDCFRAPCRFVPDWLTDVMMSLLTCTISWDQTGALHWRIPMFVAILSGGGGLIGKTQSVPYTVGRLFTNPAHQVAQQPIFGAQLLQFVTHIQKCVSVHTHRSQSGSKVTTELRVLRTELASCHLSSV
jgi:hypothetical protein